MHIEKRKYSSRPWRLVDSDGLEVAVPIWFDHPDLGKTQVMEPIAGDTRKKCERLTMDLLEQLLNRLSITRLA